MNAREKLAGTATLAGKTKYIRISSMIPRTVQMAAEVAAQFTSTELDDYGNIILNGYESNRANTIGKKAWQYAETLTAPVDLPYLVTYRPAYKGWTNQYQEYYTQKQPNGYGVDPGDPTMFSYSVHSFTPATGPITSIGGLQGGSGYTPGIYTNVPVISPRGNGAQMTVTVNATGIVISAVLTAPGTGYAVGDGLTAAIAGGSLFCLFVTGITPTSPAGLRRFAQPPRRLNQQKVSSVTPPQYVNNPEAIQYSFLYPVVDNIVPPPIDIV